jgi:hypothetical protein
LDERFEAFLKIVRISNRSERVKVRPSSFWREFAEVFSGGCGGGGDSVDFILKAFYTEMQENAKNNKIKRRRTPKRANNHSTNIQETSRQLFTNSKDLLTIVQGMPLEKKS